MTRKSLKITLNRAKSTQTARALRTLAPNFPRTFRASKTEYIRVLSDDWCLTSHPFLPAQWKLNVLSILPILCRSSEQ
jgi:hypothetical protein